MTGFPLLEFVSSAYQGQIAVCYLRSGVQLLLLRIFILGAGYICFVAICLRCPTSHLIEVVIRNRCGNDKRKTRSPRPRS